MNNWYVIFKKEFGAIINNMVFYVFAAIFVFSSTLLALNIGQIIEINRADLISFFQFHPFIYMVLIPALTMRMWAQEEEIGTINILLSLPIKSFALVLGKYLANCAALGLALLFSFGFWAQISTLGNVDTFASLSSYFGSFLCGATFIAIGQTASASVKRQFSAFILALLLGFVFVFSGLGIFDGTNIKSIFEFAAKFSIYKNFQNVIDGQISAPALIYFISVIIFCLIINSLQIAGKRSKAI